METKIKTYDEEMAEEQAARAELLKYPQMMDSLLQLQHQAPGSAYCDLLRCMWHNYSLSEGFNDMEEGARGTETWLFLTLFEFAGTVKL